MKKIKKMPLVISTLIVLVLIASISIFIFNAREYKNKESLKIDQKVSNEKLETNEIDQNISKEDQEKKVTEEKKVNENKENEKTINESVTKNENINNQNKATTKSNNSQSNNTEKKDVVPKQESATPQPVEPQKTCTPKKFTFSYVRADFSSFAACKEMGEKYRKGGYRYICDNYQDDCGDTYYMLSLTEANSSVELDYHTIPVPTPKLEEMPNE